MQKPGYIFAKDIYQNARALGKSPKELLLEMLEWARERPQSAEWTIRHPALIE